MALIYRFLEEKNHRRAYDIHPDGRKFGFFKDFRFNFAVVEEADESATSLICEGHYDFDVTLGKAEETGDIKIAGYMTPEQVELWNLGAFYELFMWPRIESVHVAAVNRLATIVEQIMVVSCCLESFGISNTIATQYATDFVNSSTKPSFRTLGTVEIPVYYKQIFET